MGRPAFPIAALWYRVPCYLCMLKRFPAGWPLAPWGICGVLSWRCWSRKSPTSDGCQRMPPPRGCSWLEEVSKTTLGTSVRTRLLAPRRCAYVRRRTCAGLGRRRGKRRPRPCFSWPAFTVTRWPLGHVGWMVRLLRLGREGRRPCRLAFGQSALVFSSPGGPNSPATIRGLPFGPGWLCPGAVSAFPWLCSGIRGFRHPGAMICVVGLLARAASVGLLLAPSANGWPTVRLLGLRWPGPLAGKFVGGLPR